MSKESISKVYLILEKIEYIEQIVENNGGIVKSLEDSVTLRPAILMHLTAIAEQFNKLKKDHANDILSAFDDKDVKGMYDVRTYIAHEYEGVNLSIVEWIVRNGLPKFKKQCQEIINNATKEYK
ncbi:HepT-like ribonuclease domain-containing protein [Sulfurimonas sp.]|uniref:HepT-like ribonuclease domain-containing protein n=1 Tax=Sulfurimonas sp. TaxID=2022749 RepID=UPI003D0E7765